MVPIATTVAAPPRCFRRQTPRRLNAFRDQSTSAWYDRLGVLGDASSDRLRPGRREASGVGVRGERLPAR
jgi:hypothetical protein